MNRAVGETSREPARARRVLFIGKNQPDGYSGGRIHAWFTAMALAELGHRVFFLTNHRPAFAGEYRSDTSTGVSCIAAPAMLGWLPQEPFDLVVVVPNLHQPDRLIDDDWILLRRAVRRARRDAAPMVLLSFETPNWIASVLGAVADPRRYRYWGALAAHASAIVSISHEGSHYAREYYRPFNQDLRFKVCYPCINTRACDAVPEPVVGRQLAIISRLSDVHKGARYVRALLDERLRGWTIQLVIGAGGIPDERALLTRAAEYDIALVVRSRITDAEKFAILKGSELLVYPSLFEGYGLPPVEARYCGARVVAFDIPVLREVNGGAAGVFLVPVGDAGAMVSRVHECIGAPADRRQIVRDVRQLASFDGFLERVDEVFSAAMAGRLPSA